MMPFIFELTSRHNSWLSVRQSLVAQNVANANTPGFRALDVKPFAETLAETRLDLAGTHKGHVALGPAALIEADPEPRKGGATLHSGNSVALEREFAKSGEVARAFALNTSVMKSFQRMLLLSTKG